MVNNNHYPNIMQGIQECLMSVSHNGKSLPESWLDLDSERLTAEASRDWSIMPMFTLCLYGSKAPSRPSTRIAWQRHMQVKTSLFPLFNHAMEICCSLVQNKMTISWVQLCARM